MTIKMNIKVWAIDKLIPYEKNAKKHPTEQIKKIAESLKMGWDQPIVVDEAGVIIKGHGRRLAALHLKMTEVPVWIRDDLNPDEVRAMRLADNRVAESSIDAELFKQELAELDFDMGGFFDAKELAFSIADLGTLSDGGFVDDVAAAVDSQAQQVREIAQASTEKPVSIMKLLGFKDVPGNRQIEVSRFMAGIEQKTGKKGQDAFLDFIRTVE